MAGALRISEATSLAFHSMVFIAQNGEKRATTKKIADVFGVSAHHLAKVHQHLVTAGLLSGTRGPNGGFSLKKPPDQISLLHIYEAIEGPFVPRKCLFDQPLCGRTNCIFGGLIHSVNAQIADYFKKTMLAELIE